MVNKSPVSPSHCTPPPFRGVGDAMGGDAMGSDGDAAERIASRESVRCDAAKELAKNCKQPNGTYRIGVTAEGRRAGQWHHGAHLSDCDIDLIRELHEPSVDQVTGQVRPGLGYRTLARKFETSKSTIRDIVKCRRRFAVVVRFKTVRVTDG